MSEGDSAISLALSLPVHEGWRFLGRLTMGHEGAAQHCSSLLSTIQVGQYQLASSELSCTGTIKG